MGSLDFTALEKYTSDLQPMVRFKIVILSKRPLGLLFPCALVLWLFKVAKNETLRIEACPGTTAGLPCSALLPHKDPSDRSLAAFWYKDDQVAPFYMVDGRTSQDIDQGRHRRLSTLGHRAVFNVSDRVLYLEVESREDSGMFVCRVDSYRSLTRTSTVELHVKAPTPKLVIYNGDTVLGDVVGPYNEGSDLELTCELTGIESGPVQVLWRIQGRTVDSTFKASPNGRIRNDYLLRSLHRSQWMETLSCLAVRNHNSSGEPSLITSVQLDLFLKPLGVRITPAHEHTRAGTVLELHCRSWGSRPPADITWWTANHRFVSNVSTSSRLGPDGSTDSTIRLYPPASDHGLVVTCRAENPVMPGVAVSDKTVLNVTFPPKVLLSLKTYSSSSISEGDTVALICNVMSNPPVGQVHWIFVQETSVPPDTKLFPMDGPQTLVLERLQPWHKGSYRCKANNSEGVGESSSLWLAVRHRPICRSGQRVSYGAQLGETLSVKCEVEAEPQDVTFHWGVSSPARTTALDFSSRGLRSVASYTPVEESHLGALFCWANNSAGEQHVPCTFTVFKPEVPNPPKNCRATNRTRTSFMVTCELGYDGGAAQVFHFRTSPKKAHSAELSLVSPRPVFSVTGLPEGTVFEVRVFARNKMGRSGEVVLETSTSNGQRNGTTGWSTNRSIFVSSLFVICFSIIFFGIAAVLRRRPRPFLL
ncbi:hypothetical protein JTE90_008452 [Oedothorax gibbosus]|uniref:Nephrin n=1 Tax=Oedothorax gibbosus TaxID=931172 RepID=A0AAV6UT92_9ARAC|nr:hypothetical protein JTE90_008452 [Oedothorax gibbosus]